MSTDEYNFSCLRQHKYYSGTIRKKIVRKGYIVSVSYYCTCHASVQWREDRVQHNLSYLMGPTKPHSLFPSHYSSTASLPRERLLEIEYTNTPMHAMLRIIGNGLGNERYHAKKLGSKAADERGSGILWGADTDDWAGSYEKETL